MEGVSLTSVLCLVFVGISQIHAACFPDEIEYSGSCYYFARVDETVNYHIAKQRCKDYHHASDLVSIDSKAENDWLTNQAKSHTWGGSAYLVGATDTGKESSFIWADGHAFDFNKWGPGQPDNFLNSEDCLALYRPLGLASDYFWADVSCDVPAELYICERSAGGGGAGGTDVVG